MLQTAEDRRSFDFGDESDPICDCGEVAYACCCEQMAEQIGCWSDGTLYEAE